MGGEKGVFSHVAGGGHYPPQTAYPAYHGYPYNYTSPGGYPPAGYPQGHSGYPSYVCPPPAHHVYPPAAYPGSSAPCYSGHGHRHGLGAFLAGGAAAVAAGYGGHHHHHHSYGSHGYGYYGHHHHHGKFKHYKRAKFGKRWKHGGLYGKHKMWK